MLMKTNKLTKDKTIPTKTTNHIETMTLINITYKEFKELFLIHQCLHQMIKHKQELNFYTIITQAKTQ